MQPTDSGQTGAEHRFVLILWAAMLGAVVMYFVVMRLLPAPPPRDHPGLATVFTVIAAVLVAASFLVRNRLMDRAREAGKPELRRVARILGWALCDAAALLGLVAWLLTGTPLSYYPLALGFLGVLLHFPAREIG